MNTLKGGHEYDTAWEAEPNMNTLKGVHKYDTAERRSLHWFISTTDRWCTYSR